MGCSGGRRCFVTVGSTSFDELVHAVVGDTDVLAALQSLNVTELKVQCGAGTIPKGFREEKNDEKATWGGQRGGIKVTIYRYKEDIKAEMKEADLIIGHAGAGTIMEALELGKPLLVVINLSLMNNHQVELAERLAADEHLLFTQGTRELAKTLLDPRLFDTRALPKADPKLFPTFLDDL